VELNGGILSRAIRYAIEREKGEQQLLKFNEELERRVWERTVDLIAANQVLEAFSAAVSHDLRGPLQIIDGYSQLVEDSHANVLSVEGVKYLDRIHKSVKQMAGIIENLLRLSRMGRKELSILPTDLDDLVTPILAGYQSRGNGRKFEWIVESLPQVQCDRGLVAQVFENLISNAVKYTGQRDLAIIEIGQTEAQGELVFFIRDNGAGFDMSNAQKLFRAFQRLHRDEEFEGTGVGLATVRRIVERHGGRIWAESEIGKGAVFYFTLSAGKTSRMAVGVR
jgi:light-regulated signal transduction histidine kinase (bacteriophytochrome)